MLKNVRFRKVMDVYERNRTPFCGVSGEPLSRPPGVEQAQRLPHQRECLRTAAEPSIYGPLIGCCLASFEPWA